jgi:hypothetical protein
MSRRALTIGGLVVAGGAGYYLYSAGGDPKVAQKNLEGTPLCIPAPESLC